MNPNITRRTVLRTSALGSLAAMTGAFHGAAELQAAGPLKGNIHHSACRWCYGGIALKELCRAAKEIGIQSIDLLGPEDWKTVQDFGLTCAMASGAGMGIEKGFNREDYHDQLVESYEKLIPLAAEAGLPNVICFSGNRNGLDDEEGIEICARGLKRLMKLAEQKKVNVVMELLNSRVDHKDYQCDHTEWGVKLCKKIGSDRFKLLYDVYHMQIMEGDLIATIKRNAEFIAHYHTGGVPGRHEIDARQEIHYPAVMKAIVETGFEGFVAQEFVPTGSDPLKSLREAIAICDV
jgi:hydroxypyruvate isomerase